MGRLARTGAGCSDRCASGASRRAGRCVSGTIIGPLLGPLRWFASRRLPPVRVIGTNLGPRGDHFGTSWGTGCVLRRARAAPTRFRARLTMISFLSTKAQLKRLFLLEKQAIFSLPYRRGHAKATPVFRVEGRLARRRCPMRAPVSKCADREQTACTRGDSIAVSTYKTKHRPTRPLRCDKPARPAGCVRGAPSLRASDSAFAPRARARDFGVRGLRARAVRPAQARDAPMSVRQQKRRELSDG